MTAKKIIVILMALVASVGMARADKYTINREELPLEAREFITTHFPKAKIAMIKVDRHLLKKTDYDVHFVNGTKVEFNNSGKWTSVEMKKGAVPSAIVPKRIRDYVTKNYDGTDIVEIEKDHKGYTVELADDIELKFDLLGTFRKVDFPD